MNRVSVILAALAAVIVVTIPQQAVAACPNEERRIEQGAAALSLPDCRAYELVSPGHVVGQDARPAKVSISGDRITYYATRPASHAETSSYYYFAVRGRTGWVVESAAPQLTPAVLSDGVCEQNVYFSPDLTLSIDEEGWFESNEPARCKRVGTVLVPGEPRLHRNVFLRDLATDSYQLMNVTPVDVDPANAKFQDASDDFSQIIFSSEAELTPDAPAGYNFFIWSDGAVHLLIRNPAGDPVNGELVEAAGHQTAGGTIFPGSGMAPVTGAFSADGERIFLYIDDALYLRHHPDEPQSPVFGELCTDPLLACTVQVDASQGSGASGGGVFWRADNSGSRVFFTAESRLTPDATAAPGAADLYAYDVESGDLTDLTVSAGESTDVRGVVATAEDGGYIYFVANGVLAPGATPGTCRGPQEAGQRCNLYVHHAGTTIFVASLSRADSAVWQETIPPNTDPRRKQRELRASASPSGRFLAFTSVEQLTGYDNRNIIGETPQSQIFLYDAAANGGFGQLECASCAPSGERPHNAVKVVFDGNYGSGSPGGNASWKVSGVLDDGSVYFDSPEALVGADFNGLLDVYQYRDGQHHLISTGTHSAAVRFLGVNPSGSDIFLRTAEPLLSSDTDGENASIYDARVGGGFPQPLLPPPACASEACRPSGEAVPPPPLPATAATAGSPAKKHRANRRCRRAKARKTARRCQRAGKDKATKGRGKDNSSGANRHRGDSHRAKRTHE